MRELMGRRAQRVRKVFRAWLGLQVRLARLVHREFRV